MRSLNSILDAEDAVATRRAEDLVAKGVPASQQARNRRILLTDAGELTAWRASLTPPAPVLDLHASAVAYFGKLVEWLTLEIRYAESGVEQKRVAASSMIPEIKARANTLLRQVTSVESTYQLAD